VNPQEYVDALRERYPETPIGLATYNRVLRASTVRAIDLLVSETLRCQVEHGFDATPGEDIALIHSEASEALEEIREDAWDRTYDEKLKPLGVASELADIIIRVLAFAGKHNLDLSDMIVRKMLYNETRPYKHGGKTL
jgi:NTP pyrophosphatase (non-canonical NTP hydrolase)